MASQRGKRTNLHHEQLSLEIRPIKQYDSQGVKEVRKKNMLTQELLAKFMGISKKTVEAWEAGRNIPNGPSSRLLEMLECHQINIERRLSICSPKKKSKNSSHLCVKSMA